jgi:hypothetical protein
VTTAPPHNCIITNTDDLLAQMSIGVVINRFIYNYLYKNHPDICMKIADTFEKALLPLQKSKI